MAPRRIILAGGLIALAGLLAYLGSFSGPFVLDDVASIPGNPTIRHLGSALSPPAREGITVSGRPVLNLSLALNWAVSGNAVWSYHAANLLIHLLAGLTLFGIVRRTLADSAGEERALWIAWAAALLWTVHPLQTESVTYVVQRAESLMGLFYLLTLYCFIRYADETPGRSDETLTRSAPFDRSPRERLEHPRSGTRKRFVNTWAAGSIIFCLLGMATKEVMVSAPLMVFLYDRVFLAGSFGEAWRRRRGCYCALAATWIPLACLVLSTGNRGGTSGAGIGVGPWQYWQTQSPAILRYLGLAVWPRPLVFDYGTEWIRHAAFAKASAAGAALIVLALLAATAWLWRRRPAWGYAALFFFVILAPSSIIPGNRQTMAEQRMYLALAPLAVAAAVALSRSRNFLLLTVALAASLAGATYERNRTYRTALALYSDNAAKKPANAFAHGNLGGALADAGRDGEAAGQYAEAIRLKPDYAEAFSNLGEIEARAGHLAEAEASFRRAVEFNPGLPEAHQNLGSLLAMTGRLGPAEVEYRAALRLRPDYAEAHLNLARLLRLRGRNDEAADELARANAARPRPAPP